MYINLLIDGIVRQTTILLAQLSTSSGVRAPLAKVADQVFLKLAQEIEAQGVAKPVVADMFGLALRTYQKKTRRIAESGTERGRTLWEAIYTFVAEEPRDRKRILERFKHDGERETGAVLQDLMSSGLIFQTGAGARAVYGVTNEQMRERIQHTADVEAVSSVIWLALFRQEARTKAQLLAQLGIDEVRIDEALKELQDTARISIEGEQLVASNVVIPLESDAKEAAMLDHFQAVTKVLARKAHPGATTSEDGGSTYTFSVQEGHPHEQEVRSLLAQTRKATEALWDKVAAYNREIALDRESADRVTFYCGQITQTKGIVN